MSLDAALAIGLCGWLSRFQIKTLWSSVLKTKPRQNISSGEALLFWTMNHLERLNIVTRDQLQLAFEHFGKHIVEHGNVVNDKWLKFYMDTHLDPCHKLGLCNPTADTQARLHGFQLCSHRRVGVLPRLELWGSHRRHPWPQATGNPHLRLDHLVDHVPQDLPFRVGFS
jgi:hypothetical protein